MKLTNGEVFNAGQPLQILMGTKLPVKVAFQVAKVANKINSKRRVIEVVRDDLIKRYGIETGHGGFEVVGPNDSKGRPVSPKWEDFVRELNELMDVEDEMVFDVIKIPETTPIDIEPSVLLALEKFIEVV